MAAISVLILQDVAPLFWGALEPLGEIWIFTIVHFYLKSSLEAQDLQSDHDSLVFVVVV